MIELMLPTGRMIGGDLYKMFPVTDSFGKPKMKADGVTPREEINFGVAVPKAGETHWNQTPWGAQIWEVGKAAYPQLFNSPAFAWKVVDGDSAVPNKKGVAPNTREGHPGHWVVWMKQGWAPRIVNSDGSVELGPNAILPGYYVRVIVTALGNAPSPSPGVFLNPKAVALMAVGDVIETASQVDTSAFAAVPAGALPAGARPVVAAEPAFAHAPGQLTDIYGVVAGVTAAPNPAFLSVPPPPPAPPKGRTMTTAAGGCDYSTMIKAGWNDELLIQHGMMLP